MIIKIKLPSKEKLFENDIAMVNFLISDRKEEKVERSEIH